MSQSLPFGLAFDRTLDAEKCEWEPTPLFVRVGMGDRCDRCGEPATGYVEVAECEVVHTCDGCRRAAQDRVFDVLEAFLYQTPQ